MLILKSFNSSQRQVWPCNRHQHLVSYWPREIVFYFSTTHCWIAHHAPWWDLDPIMTYRAHCGFGAWSWSMLWSGLSWWWSFCFSFQVRGLQLWVTMTSSRKFSNKVSLSGRIFAYHVWSVWVWSVALRGGNVASLFTQYTHKHIKCMWDSSNQN